MSEYFIFGVFRVIILGSLIENVWVEQPLKLNIITNKTIKTLVKTSLFN